MVENCKHGLSLFNINSPTFLPQTWDYDQTFGPLGWSDLSSPSGGFLESFPSLRQRSGIAGNTQEAQDDPSFFFSQTVNPQKEVDEIYQRRLHISNIPFHYREMDLHLVFRPFGMVESVQIIYNDVGSQGYGFVTMQTGESALTARNSLNNTWVGGRIVTVNRAFPKSKMVKQSGVVGLSCSCGGASILDLLRAEAKLAEAQFAVLSIKHQLLLCEKNNQDNI